MYAIWWKQFMNRCDADRNNQNFLHFHRDIYTYISVWIKYILTYISKPCKSKWLETNVCIYLFQTYSSLRNIDNTTKYIRVISTLVLKIQISKRNTSWVYVHAATYEYRYKSLSYDTEYLWTWILFYYVLCWLSSSSVP